MKIKNIKIDIVTIMFVVLALSLMIGMMAIPVSALEFDNTKDVNYIGEKYPQIEIKNLFGFGETLWKGDLNYNSDNCISKCSATMEIYLGKKGVLVENVKFEEVNYGIRTPISIKNYQFSYRLKGETNWNLYIIGTEIKKGTYELKLDGEKPPFKTIDWIIETQGEILNEWALWGEANIMFYYNMTNTSATAILDLTGNEFNATIIPDATGNPSYITDGMIGGAYRNFSGNLGNRFINVTGDGNVSRIFAQNNTFSLFMWVNFSGGSGDPSPFTMGTTAGWNTILATADGRFGFGQVGVAVAVECTDNLLDNSWHHVGVIVNETSGIGLWVDNANCANGTKTFNTTLATGDIQIGGANYLNAYIDEVGFWNVTLNASDVSLLYNSGAGLAFGSVITVSLDAPADNFETNLSNTNITFDCSVVSGNQLTNMSFWHNATGTWHRNKTNIITGTSNDTNFTEAFPPATFIWNCEGGDNSGSTNFASANRTIRIVNVAVNNQTFNGQVYETGNETYTVNVSANSSLTGVNLVWNGTSYSATQSGQVWSRTIDIPTGITTRTFHWNFTFGGTTLVSTPVQNVTISGTNFSICEGEGGSTPFLNFTFRDEGNQSYLQSGTIPLFETTYYLTGGTGAVNKSYTFTNTTASDNYMFCSTPSDRNLTVNYSVQYEDINGNYPQRVLEANPTLSNDTTNTTLYLLLSSDGIYVTFQVVNQAEQPIENVHSTAIRTIGGASVTVGEGDTGADGGITFWLNPDYSHTFTFEATGYDTYTTVLTPTQSSYTIVLGGTGDAIDEEDYVQGVSYSIYPPGSILTNNTDYTFNFTINSSYWEIDEFGFILTNGSGTHLGTTSASTNGGTVDLDINTGLNSSIIMDYYYVIDGNYSNASRTWLVIDEGGADWSILNFFDDLSTYLTSGMFGLDNFGLAILLFLLIFVFTGIMSYKFGLVSPAGILTLVFTLVLFFDVGLGLMDDLNPVSQIPHFPTIFIGIILAGIFFREATR